APFPWAPAPTSRPVVALLHSLTLAVVVSVGGASPLLLRAGSRPATPQTAALTRTASEVTLHLEVTPTSLATNRFLLTLQNAHRQPPTATQVKLCLTMRSAIAGVGSDDCHGPAVPARAVLPAQSGTQTARRCPPGHATSLVRPRSG